MTEKYIAFTYWLRTGILAVKLFKSENEVETFAIEKAKNAFEFSVKRDLKSGLITDIKFVPLPNEKGNGFNLQRCEGASLGFLE